MTITPQAKNIAKSDILFSNLWKTYFTPYCPLTNVDCIFRVNINQANFLIIF